MIRPLMAEQSKSEIFGAPKSKCMTFELFEGRRMIHKVIETIRYKDRYYFVVSGGVGNLLAA